MRGFNRLKQELDVLKNEGSSIAPKIEEAIQNYQRQAEEVERALLREQANEWQSLTKQEEAMKPR
jgi:hypothetical protein